MLLIMKTVRNPFRFGGELGAKELIDRVSETRVRDIKVARWRISFF
jgi:hypothetical protein